MRVQGELLTATALHWLHSEPLAALYGRVADLVRDGGVFMNADHMIDGSTPRINAAERTCGHSRMDHAKQDGTLGWSECGSSLPRTPSSPSPPPAASRSTATMPTGTCRRRPGTRVLCEKGFGEARAVWCSPSDTLLLALK